MIRLIKLLFKLIKFIIFILRRFLFYSKLLIKFFFIFLFGIVKSLYNLFIFLKSIEYRKLTKYDLKLALFWLCNNAKIKLIEFILFIFNHLYNILKFLLNKIFLFFKKLKNKVVKFIKNRYLLIFKYFKRIYKFWRNFIIDYPYYIIKLYLKFFYNIFYLIITMNYKIFLDIKKFFLKCFLKIKTFYLENNITYLLNRYYRRRNEILNYKKFDYIAISIRVSFKVSNKWMNFCDSSITIFYFILTFLDGMDVIYKDIKRSIKRDFKTLFKIYFSSRSFFITNFIKFWIFFLFVTTLSFIRPLFYYLLFKWIKYSFLSILLLFHHFLFYNPYLEDYFTDKQREAFYEIYTTVVKTFWIIESIPKFIYDKYRYVVSFKWFMPFIYRRKIYIRINNYLHWKVDRMNIALDKFIYFKENYSMIFAELEAGIRWHYYNTLFLFVLDIYNTYCFFEFWFKKAYYTYLIFKCDVLIYSYTRCKLCKKIWRFFYIWNEINEFGWDLLWEYFWIDLRYVQNSNLYAVIVMGFWNIFYFIPLKLKLKIKYLPKLYFIKIKFFYCRYFKKHYFYYPFWRLKVRLIYFRKYLYIKFLIFLNILIKFLLAFVFFETYRLISLIYHIIIERWFMINMRREGEGFLMFSLHFIKAVHFFWWCAYEFPEMDDCRLMTAYNYFRVDPKIMLLLRQFFRISIMCFTKTFWIYTFIEAKFKGFLFRFILIYIKFYYGTNSNIWNATKHLFKYRDFYWNKLLWDSWKFVNYKNFYLRKVNKNFFRYSMYKYTAWGVLWSYRKYGMCDIFFNNYNKKYYNYKHELEDLKIVNFNYNHKNYCRKIKQRGFSADYYTEDAKRFFLFLFLKKFEKEINNNIIIINR